MIQVYDPTGRQHSGDTKGAPRPDTLDGRRLAFVWNRKANGDVYLDEFAEFLSQRYSALTIEHYSKPSPSMPLDADDFEQACRCDAVVAVLGDCGSCSSWTCRDAVSFEERGVPCVAVVTDPFARKTQFEAQALGLESIALVVLPHPVGYLELPAARAVFHLSFPQAIGALTAAPA